MNFNQLKKLFGKNIRTIEYKFYGNSQCMVDSALLDFNVEIEKNYVIKTTNYMYEFNDVDKLPCNRTGILIKDIYNRLHELVTYININGEQQIIVIPNRYERIYKDSKLIVCLNVGIPIFISDSAFSFRVAISSFSEQSLLEMIKLSIIPHDGYVFSYSQIVREVSDD